MDKKKFGYKNLIVVAILVALICLVGGLALAKSGAQPAGEQPDGEVKPAYLVINVAGTVYNPIRLDGEDRYTITRGDMVNVIAVTPDSVTMHSSTCDNQDCVLQGTVSLENRHQRVLQNAILCLPNEVMLELYTEEEARELYPLAFTDAEGNDE